MSIAGAFQDHLETFAQAAGTAVPALEQIAHVVTMRLRAGDKLLVCGNGGSAADAQHFAGELVGRRGPRVPASAIALATDGALLTALGNDVGFDHVFAHQVRALGRPGDVLLAISTSGESKNVLVAVDAARALGCTVVALTGRAGSRLASRCDHGVHVPSDHVARIQEVHAVCLHALAAAIIERLDGAV